MVTLRTTRRAPSSKHPARFFGLLILLIAVFGAAITYTAGEGESVTLTVGRSTVLDTGRPIARVSLTSADVADALVTSSSELLINGKTPGTISMFVWDRSGAIRRYEVVVQRDLGRLSEQLRDLFPGETIAAQNNGRSIVLSGAVSTKDVADRAVAVAAGYVDKKDDVVSLMQLTGFRGNQVLLRVRVAEVSRTALTELGAQFALHGFKDGRWFGRSTTEQFPAPQWDRDGRLVFSDFLNLFLFDSKEGIAGVVRALSERGLFQSLAEPNVVAESGKEASFLAGGEVPIPIAQPSNGTVALTVQYKEFGIRLNFTPVVNGNRVHLKVRPEVSTLDYANAVVLQGFRIPAFTTRRTETEVELDNGQTFSIAGLLNNTVNSSLQKIPGIGDIPILGLLFKSKAAQKGNTELVVMITPENLPNDSVGVTPDLAKPHEEFLKPQKKLLEPPPPPFPGTSTTTSPRSSQEPQPTAAPMTSAQKPQAQTSAAKPDSANTVVDPKKQAKLVETGRKRAEKVQKNAQEQRKQDEKAAREKAKRDAEAAKRMADIEKAANEAAAKRAAEAAKKQSEMDKGRQKSLDDAQARLKDAEAAYQAELAKRNPKN